MPWFSCVSFFQVCVLCEDGFIRLHLLSVCCWRSHVMSIMGSPSCLEPELLASVSLFSSALFHAVLFVLTCASSPFGSHFFICLHYPLLTLLSSCMSFSWMFIVCIVWLLCTACGPFDLSQGPINTSPSFFAVTPYC